MKKIPATIGNVQKWRLQRRVIKLRKFCHRKDCMHRNDLLKMIICMEFKSRSNNWRWYDISYEMIAEGLY